MKFEVVIGSWGSYSSRNERSLCSDWIDLAKYDSWEEIEEELKKQGFELDGMDEVVVELVRCKTENETLRYKMNELNKELYNIKNELSKYHSLGLGLYVKKNNDSSLV